MVLFPDFLKYIHATDWVIISWSLIFQDADLSNDRRSDSPCDFFQSHHISALLNHKKLCPPFEVVTGLGSDMERLLHEQNRSS
jgi:hypothetical protein